MASAELADAAAAPAAGGAPAASYAQGHSAPVLATHAQRTAEEHAAYALPAIAALYAEQPRMRILDVGCGPGSITVGLAARFPLADVIGLETAAGAPALDVARELARDRRVANVRFVVGEVHSMVSQLDDELAPVPVPAAESRPHDAGSSAAAKSMPPGSAADDSEDRDTADATLSTAPPKPRPARFAPGSIDVVHCHQLLQHCGQPVHALSQMRRICRAGGFVAARTADLGRITYTPGEGPAGPATRGTRAPGHALAHPIRQWQRLMLAVIFEQKGEPRAGAFQAEWARAAGFGPARIHVSHAIQSWGDSPESVQLQAALYAERLVHGHLRAHALRLGLATELALRALARDVSGWAATAGAGVAIWNAEMLCWV